MKITPIPSGRSSTIYTKASISRVHSGTVTALDGNVTLRMDVLDYSNSTPDEVGFTVLSSKDSNLFYSNRWILDSNVWKTRTQLLASGVVAIG